jgi:hypothetical protein
LDISGNLARTRPRSRVRLLGAAVASALATLVVISLTVLAGEGNPNYLGILSSTAPSGYKPSPAWYDLSKGENTFTFQFDVANLTNEQQTMTLSLSLDHIITYGGQDVSDGQPGVINGAVVDGHDAPSTQVQDAHPTLTTLTIAAHATTTMHMSRALAAGQCGYFQFDVAKAGLENQKGLIGGAIRVLGCTTTVPSPSPSPSPGGGVGGGPAPSPSPEASPSPSPGTSPSPSPSPTPGGGTGGANGGTPPSGGVAGATATTSGIGLANTGLPIIGGLLGVILLTVGGVGLRVRRN